MPRHKAEALDTEDESRGIAVRIGCLSELDEDSIREHLARKQFFWLDLSSPTPEVVERLGELFEFHPLAIKDALKFGQRPKLEDY